MIIVNVSLRRVVQSIPVWPQEHDIPSLPLVFPILKIHPVRLPEQGPVPVNHLLRPEERQVAAQLPGLHRRVPIIQSVLHASRMHGERRLGTGEQLRTPLRVILHRPHVFIPNRISMVPVRRRASRERVRREHHKRPRSPIPTPVRQRRIPHLLLSCIRDPRVPGHRIALYPHRHTQCAPAPGRIIRCGGTRGGRPGIEILPGIPVHTVNAENPRLLVSPLRLEKEPHLAAHRRSQRHALPGIHL